MLIEEMSVGWYALILSIMCLIQALAWIGSIILSWRASKTPHPRSGHAWRWYSLVAIWLLSFVLNWGLVEIARSYHRPFHSASTSMAPTLEKGDSLLADMHDIDPIKRGDVVMLKVRGQDWIRRVVGIPGDRVAMEGGIVILNGRRAEQEFVRRREVGSTGYDFDIQMMNATISSERFPDEAKPHLVIDALRIPLDDYPEIVLPPGQYFLLGDNRDNSLDSRQAPEDFGHGLVSREMITGKMEFIYWTEADGYLLGD
jgi:signal peptidase I